MIKAAQLRLHKEKVLGIEGDDEDADMQGTGHGQTENGFELRRDGKDTWYPSATFDEPEAAQTWVDTAADQSFLQVGQAAAEKMTLNRLQ